MISSITALNSTARKLRNKMTCNLKPVEGVKEPADCKCYGAVLRTFKTLKAANCPEVVAREAALRVYRFHHPEDQKHKAQLTVESWIYAGHAH